MTQEKPTKQNKRITISFSEEFEREYDKISSENKKSEIMCLALREYYKKEEEKATIEDLIDNMHISEENIIEQIQIIQKMLIKMCTPKKTE